MDKPAQPKIGKSMLNLIQNRATLQQVTGGQTRPRPRPTSTGIRPA